MKVLLQIVLIVLTSFRLSSQDDVVYTIVEKPAEFPGGTSAMYKFIQKELKYPRLAMETGIGGKVFLKFIVDEKGILGNVEILKSAGLEELDEAAVEIIKKMPAWNPAQMTDKPVKCYFNLPVNFMLDEPYFIFSEAKEDVSLQRAKTSILSGDFKTAGNILENASDAPYQVYNYGVICYKNKKKKEARECFEKVIAMQKDPEASLSKICKRNLDKYF